MRILLTGSSGLIGRALLSFLTTNGHEVVQLVRPQSHSSGSHLTWDPAAGKIDPTDLEDFDAVVHLAGETIVGRWTPAKKARIRETRVRGTQLLCEALATLRKPAKVLISTSATGYYGDRGDQLLREDSGRGSLFLSEVAEAWESATEAAVRTGIRIVNPRVGFVLSKAGGGLATMLLPFKLGLGGRVGSGRQYISWIAIDDVVGIIGHAMVTETLRGAVNTVSPQAVTNLEFTKTLGRVLHRPTIFPLPAFAARLAMGELADNLLLASARVEPAELLASGYRFQFPDLTSALRHVLARN